MYEVLIGKMINAILKITKNEEDTMKIINMQQNKIEKLEKRIEKLEQMEK